MRAQRPNTAFWSCAVGLNALFIHAEPSVEETGQLRRADAFCFELTRKDPTSSS
jgi:hypothetical protein